MLKAILSFAAPLVARVSGFIGFGWLAALIPGGGIMAAGASMFSAALAFFATPVGRWVGIGLIGAGLYLAGDLHRAHVDHAEWTREVQMADAARAERDKTIRAEVSQEAAERIAGIQKEAEALKQKVTDYETTLSTRGGDTACRLSPDDARRLRKL